MRTFDVKTLATMAVFGIIAIIGLGEMANGQGNRRSDDRQERRAQKQREKIEKQQAKLAQRRVILDRQRQTEWTRRNTQVWNSQQTNTNGIYSINVNAGTDRYRIYRNGSYYNTNYRGAELLRQAVNDGYRQGFEAGRRDRVGTRNVSWSNSNVYRSGTMGYQTYVDRGQYQYYFRQGFQRGYQDGSNSRYQDGYNGEYEYGYYENGSMNVLDRILNTVLNIQTY